MTLKQFIYRTPFVKTIKDIEASLLHMGINSVSSNWKGRRTVYCISPYKTGTTFLASSFNESVAQHEPLHYVTLKNLDKDFDTFFIKRLNKLDLKLECSGFWSGYVDQLAAHEIAKDLDYICILREPSAWITSCVNFWNRPYTKAMKFEFENEAFWKPQLGIDFRDIVDENNQVNQEKIDRVLDFYFEFTRKTQKLKNIHYIKLKELGDHIPGVGELIGEKPDMAKSWMRKAKKKNFVYRNEEIDRKYNELIATFKPFTETFSVAAS